jgi:type IV secretion system protein VirB8
VSDDLAAQKRKEYHEFIKESVANGSYFKDARDWYIFRYVLPICERTTLFFVAIVAGIITYVLAMTIINSFPIKEQVNIIIRPKDQAVYVPYIKKLRDSVELRNVDEVVAKYLLTKYLEKRENYNFREINLTKLNNRLNYIKNNSSDAEYKKFQNFLSKDNPESPMLYYGRDFQRIVNIESVSFKRDQKDNLLDKAIDFIPNKIPSQVDIRYTITNKVNSRNVGITRYLTRINFKFSGVDAKNKAKSQLNFTVISYKTYKIK